MNRYLSFRFRSCAWRRYLAISTVVATAVLAHGRLAFAQAPVNKMCPVMTLEEADPSITTVYRGKTIAFCCDNCLKKFRANPDQYADRLAVFSNDQDSHEEHQQEPNETASASDHDHGSAETKIPLLARFHPIVVHFPLAGTPIALVAMLAWLGSRKKLFAYGDVPPLVLAAASSVVGVVTGNMAHDSMRFSAALHDYVEWHQFTATGLMILLLILSALRLWRWRRLTGRWLAAYTAGLSTASALVGVVGFLGGSLVFGPDHLWP